MATTYNNLEEYIMKLLNRIEIFHPCQLSIEKFCLKLNLSIYYIPHNSMAITGNIFLDNRDTEIVQWQNFGHELCHALWHAGDQALIPISMRDYQEWKAESFAQHFCIPTFMLERLELPNSDKKAIWLIAETFGVTWQFAEKRLRQHMQNLMYR